MKISGGASLAGDTNPDAGDNVTALVLTITGQNTASSAYDENAVLRAVSISRLESLSLTIAQASVGSLESFSNDYGSGSALKISDAELTSLDLDIIGQNTSSKAYDGSGLLRADSTSSLESLNLTIVCRLGCGQLWRVYQTTTEAAAS